MDKIIYILALLALILAPCQPLPAWGHGYEHGRYDDMPSWQRDIWENFDRERARDRWEARSRDMEELRERVDELEQRERELEMRRLQREDRRLFRQLRDPHYGSGPGYQGTGYHHPGRGHGRDPRAPHW